MIKINDEKVKKFFLDFIKLNKEKITDIFFTKSTNPDFCVIAIPNLAVYLNKYKIENLEENSYELNNDFYILEDEKDYHRLQFFKDLKNYPFKTISLVIPSLEELFLNSYYLGKENNLILKIDIIKLLYKTIKNNEFKSIGFYDYIYRIQTTDYDFYIPGYKFTFSIPETENNNILQNKP
ncbi:MAG: hypothetical protein ACPL1F_02330 [bacterium]